MKNQSKPKGKAVTLPETEKNDSMVETDENVRRAQTLARRVSPLALGLLEAKIDAKIEN